MSLMRGLHSPERNPHSVYLSHVTVEVHVFCVGPINFRPKNARGHVRHILLRDLW